MAHTHPLRRFLATLATTLTTSLLAQSPHQANQAAKCPFPAPRLAAADPVEVAWACNLLCDAGRPPPDDAEAADLCAALRRFQAIGTPEAQRVVLHVLHAMRIGNVAVTRAELGDPLPGRTGIARVALLLRTASPQGGELLDEFQRLQPATDVAWEVAGGTLALRGHRTFAVETWSRLQPTLRVVVGKPADAEERSEPLRDELPEMLPKFPDPPVYSWRRESTGLPYAEGWIRTTAGEGERSNGNEAATSALSADRARLRWLAVLAGKHDAMFWPYRFELQLGHAQVGQIDALIAKAHERAKASLEDIEAGLRERKLLPTERAATTPTLQVKKIDVRPAFLQRERPLSVTR